MKTNIKQTILILLLSIFISLSYYFGNILYNDKANIIYLLLMPLIFIILFFGIKVLNKIYIKDTKKEFKFLDKHIMLISFILLIIIGIPALICNYPGIVDYDYPTQFKQALGITTLNTHHCLIYTGLIYLCSLFSNYPEHILFINSIVQLVLMSLIFSYIIKYIYKSNKILAFMFFIILATFQMIPLFNVYLAKDILFSGILQLYSILIYDSFVNKEEFTNKKRILLIISLILIVLIRSNGIFIILGSLFFTILVNRKNKLLYLLFIIGIATFVLQYGLVSVLHIQKADVIESLGIPLNQIANVVYKDRELNNEEREMINALLPIEDIKANYNKHYADTIKFHKSFSSMPITNNKIGYLKLYLKLFKKYPKDYIEAWMNLTIGYWYPDVEKGSISYPYEYRYSFYDEIGVRVYSKNEVYKRYITEDVRKNIFESWMWSPGFATIIMFTLLIISYVKNKKLIYFLLPPLFGWLTLLIAAPSYCETRYVYYIFLCNIVGFILLLNKKSKIC